MTAPESGEVPRKGVRPVRPQHYRVDLPGYHREIGDDGVRIGDESDVTDAALRALEEEVEGIPSPMTMRGAKTEPIAARSRRNHEGRRECLRQISARTGTAKAPRPVSYYDY